MKSEFLQDVKDLHEAFSIHVDKDPKNRSIIVLATDNVDGKKMMQMSIIGSNVEIADSLLNFLGDKEHEGIRRLVTGVLSKKDNKSLRRISAIMFFVQLAWLCVLVWIWHFVGWSEWANSFISNVLLMIWGLFITFRGWKRF